MYRQRTLARLFRSFIRRYIKLEAISVADALWTEKKRRYVRRIYDLALHLHSGI
jgi:hypothetical protein